MCWNFESRSAARSRLLRALLRLQSVNSPSSKHFLVLLRFERDVRWKVRRCGLRWKYSKCRVPLARRCWESRDPQMFRRHVGDPQAGILAIPPASEVSVSCVSVVVDLAPSFACFISTYIGINGAVAPRKRTSFIMEFVPAIHWRRRRAD